MQSKENRENTGIFSFITSLLATLFQSNLSGSSNTGKGLGPSGLCYCPHCGYEQKHQRGVPCVSKKCSKCGTTMSRKE